MLLILSGVSEICIPLFFFHIPGSSKLTTRSLSTQVVAFLVGFVYEDIHLTLWTGLAGTALTALVVVPPWPAYNKNPESWLVPTSGGKGGGAGVMVDGVRVA